MLRSFWTCWKTFSWSALSSPRNRRRDTQLLAEKLSRKSQSSTTTILASGHESSPRTAISLTIRTRFIPDRFCESQDEAPGLCGVNGDQLPRYARHRKRASSFRTFGKKPHTLVGPANGAFSAASAPTEEPALERPENLRAHERLRVGDSAVVARDADVVLERGVRPLERVLELVALEDVVVAPRCVARPVLRVDGTADRPDAARLPLDPDEDALLGAEIVDSRDDPLREPALLRGPSHRVEDTIGPYGRRTLEFPPRHLLLPVRTQRRRGPGGDVRDPRAQAGPEPGGHPRRRLPQESLDAGKAP